MGGFFCTITFRLALPLHGSIYHRPLYEMRLHPPSDGRRTGRIRLRLLPRQHSRFCGAPTGAYPPFFHALEKGEKVEKNYLMVYARPIPNTERRCQASI